MQPLPEALDEVRGLYEKLLGRPAPEIQPGFYAAFPPGVDPVRHAVDEVERLKQLANQMEAAPAPVAWIPRADTLATKDAYVMHVEIPGVARDDLKVFVIGGECVVRGERKPPEGAVETRPLVLERPWGRFERRFPLPAGCDTEKLTARCRDGMLELEVPMAPVNVPKEKAVKVE